MMCLAKNKKTTTKKQLSVVLSLDNGAYPENSHVALCLTGIK